MKAESYGALLTPIFIKRIPSDLRLNITRKVPAADWNLEQILKVCLEEIEAREGATLANKGRQHTTPRQPRATNTFTSGGESGCVYCKQDGHGPTQCKKVVSIDDRKHVIREHGRCFNCLRRGHLGRDCRASSRCGNCNGRHHTSICRKTEKNKPFKDGSSSHSNNSHEMVSHGNPQKPRGLNPESEPFHLPEEPTAALYMGAREGIFLQTAGPLAFNVDQPNRVINVHVLMDSGSQCSHITSKASRRLRLNSLGNKEALSIMTFGSKKECQTNCEVVKVGLRVRNEKPVELKLLTVDHICEPIANAAIDLSNYPHLQTLNFAIDLECSSQVSPDILVGSDQYWNLLTGEIIKGETGPVALNTYLGWILSGPAMVKECAPYSATLVTHVLRTDGVSESKCLDRILHSFWNIESLGILESEDVVQSQFEDNVSFENGRYVVSLPWRDTSAFLPDNFQLSLRRVNSLLKRLQGTPELLERYDAIIREQLDLGIIVPVDQTEDSGASRVH